MTSIHTSTENVSGKGIASPVVLKGNVYYGIDEKEGRMTNNLIPFCEIKNDKGICTKVLGIENGKLTKDSSKCAISQGTLITKAMTLKEFGGYLQTASTDTAIIHGVPKIQGEEFKVLSCKNFMDQPGTITRTKDNFHFPTGEPGLSMFDYDYHDGTPYHPPEAFISIMGKIIPGFDQCEKLISYSTSSYIYDKDGNGISTDNPGYHLYVSVTDASDLPRFADALFKRTWLAEYGVINISKSGGQLKRAIFDKAIYSPERIDYIARPVCKDGLVQKKTEPQYIEGGFLNTHLLKDLTPEEETEYEKMVQTKLVDSEPQAQEQKKCYLEKEADKLVQSEGISEIQAKKIVERRVNQVLAHGDFLYFDAHGKIDVKDVLQDPEKYDRETMADPIEPEYGGGRNKAIFYANTSTGKPVIHSFAHGGRTFELNDEKVLTLENAKRDIDSLLENDPKPESDQWAEILYEYHLDQADQTDFLNYLVTKNLGSFRDLKNRWKELNVRYKKIAFEQKISRQGKTVIYYSPLNLTKAVEETERVLIKNSGGWPYVNFAGGLSLVVYDEPMYMMNLLDRKLKPPAVPLLKSYNEKSLRLKIETLIVYVVQNRHGEKKQIPVPKEISELLLNHPVSAAPKIYGIVTHPVIDPSGTIISKEGYDDRTKLYFAHGGAQFELLDEHCGEEQAKKGLDNIQNKLLSEYEFKDKIDLFAAVGALIMTLLRKQITLAPGIIISANVPGSGKTTLARMLHVIDTGTDMPVASISDDNPQEARKEVLSYLLEGLSMVCFDNMEEGTEIKNPIFSKMITSPLLKERRLGINQTPTVPTNTTLICTGNRLSVNKDLGRRFSLIELSPKSADPETRRFKNPDVLELCLKLRPEIIHDVLTIVKAYFNSGGSDLSQQHNPSGFLDWDKMVRFPLLWISGIDIYESIRRNKSNSKELRSMNSVLCCLQSIFKGRHFTATEVCQQLSKLTGKKDDLMGLSEGLAGLTTKNDVTPITVGLVLAKMVDVPYGNAILRRKTKKKFNCYNVEAHLINVLKTAA